MAKSLEQLLGQDYWSIPEFARLKCGRSKPWIYSRLAVDDTRRRGTIRLPDGVIVPVHRDTNGHWMLARHQYEMAVQRALKEGA